MSHRALTCLLVALTLHSPALALAGGNAPPRSADLSTYATNRVRDSRGRFALAKPVTVKASPKAPAVAEGFVYGFGRRPGAWRQNQVEVHFVPATSTEPGSLTVRMPSYFRAARHQGFRKGTSLSLLNRQNERVAVPATLSVERGSRATYYSAAVLEATIPAGTPVTRRDLVFSLRGRAQLDFESLKRALGTERPSHVSRSGGGR